jgi:hypothetical protein
MACYGESDFAAVIVEKQICLWILVTEGMTEGVLLLAELRSLRGELWNFEAGSEDGLAVVDASVHGACSGGFVGCQDNVKAILANLGFGARVDEAEIAALIELLPADILV